MKKNEKSINRVAQNFSDNKSFFVQYTNLLKTDIVENGIQLFISTQYVRILNGIWIPYLKTKTKMISFLTQNLLLRLERHYLL